jgi:ribokinase
VITVIGSINLDLIANVPRLPSPGETVPGTRFETAPGGKGANQALAARRAGAEVRMVGAVGLDAFADEALSLLREGGVDVSLVREIHASTGVALILVGDDGENVIATVPGGNGTVTAGDVRAARIEKGEIVLLQLEVPVDTVEAALKAARAAGAISVLNSAPFRAEAARLLLLADHVIANETEFDLYADALGLEGGNRTNRMADFAARTGATMVITLGGRGVVAAAPGGTAGASALPVTPVDTVGAGDTFCGYYAAALESRLPLEETLRRAAAAGSLACTRPGAQPSIPLAAEVDMALGEAG